MKPMQALREMIRKSLQILTEERPSFIKKGKVKNHGICFICIVMLLFAWPAGAENKKKQKQVVIKEATRVEGKIQKPEVWYLLPRSSLNFDSVSRKEKLAPKIVDHVKKNPF